MSTVAYTNLDYLFDSDVYTWANMAFGDDGQPMGVVASGDRTIQVEGTFGVGGQVVIEGTLDQVHWHTLHDPTGASLSLTQASLATVLENVVLLRPRVTAGDGSTQLTITIITRKQRNG